MNQPPPPEAAALLSSVFGFSHFRAGQQPVISQLLAGHSALAVFPTGGGKSLCYQLTALCLPGLTLVVSPLLALMKDQVDYLQSKGIAAERLDSSLDSNQTAAVLTQLNARTLKLLYVSPERCANVQFRSLMARQRLALVAIDEAHCISQWGPNFRPEYMQLAQFTQDIGAERTLALTATATPQVVDDIARNFRIAREHITNTGVYRSNLSLDFLPIDVSERERMLLACDFSGPTIVYVTQRWTAERLASTLAARRIAARPYHAGMATEEREEIQNWFLNSEQATVVATIAFGMGIDKPDIRGVYHYNLPKGIESYIQEIGRAGRDGKPSACKVLVSLEDVPVLANFAYGNTPTREAIAGVLATIFNGEPELELNLYELSQTFDIRDTTLKTLLTHAQLDGYLKSRQSAYLRYDFKFTFPLEEVFSSVDPGFVDRVRKFVAVAEKGKIWYHVDFGGTHKHLEPHRRRAEEILDHLKEKKLAVVKNLDVRHRYQVKHQPRSHERMTDAYLERFVSQEKMEIERLNEVLRLVEAKDCHWNLLARYFGEGRSTRCGHCSFCRRGEPVQLKPRSVPAEVPKILIEQAFQLDPEFFRHPRVLTRFLCGIPSPWLTRNKWTKHGDFGRLGEFDFLQVHQRVEEFLP